MKNKLIRYGLVIILLQLTYFFTMSNVLIVKKYTKQYQDTTIRVEKPNFKL